MSSSDKIIIAVDGYSSCGKSTLARDLAKVLGYSYIDTGAMYRAVTLYLIRHHIPVTDIPHIADALADIHLEFVINEQTGFSETHLNGENVEQRIREMDVANLVSEVSAVKEVRRIMVRLQHKMGRKRGVVMDGRDIGTTVFPDAELKLFMTASHEVRVKRRLSELHAKGITISEEDVSENIKHRDYIDTHREESPLRQAEDAVVINNTDLDRKQQLEIAMELAEIRIKEKQE